MSDAPGSLPTPSIVDFTEVPGVPCPCGSAQRAFADPGNGLFTLHTTTISNTPNCPADCSQEVRAVGRFSAVAALISDGGDGGVGIA